MTNPVFKCYICKSPNWHKNGTKKHNMSNDKKTLDKCNMFNNSISITFLLHKYKKVCKINKKKKKILSWWTRASQQLLQTNPGTEQFRKYLFDAQITVKSTIFCDITSLWGSTEVQIPPSYPFSIKYLIQEILGALKNCHP